MVDDVAVGAGPRLVLTPAARDSDVWTPAMNSIYHIPGKVKAITSPRRGPRKRKSSYVEKGIRTLNALFETKTRSPVRRVGAMEADVMR